MNEDELKAYCDELKKKRNRQQTETGPSVSQKKPKATQAPQEVKSGEKKNQASVDRDYIIFLTTIGISGIYQLTLKEYLFGVVIIFAVLLILLNPTRFKESLESKAFSRFMRIITVVIGVSLVLHLIVRILKL